MNITLWSEGYRATGGSSPATYHGIFEADTLRDAVILFKESLGDDSDARLIDVDTTPPSFWGCRFFDNASDARVSFG